MTMTRIPAVVANSRSQSSGNEVVFLITHSSAGGAQQLWQNLAQGLISRGYTVRLMALYPGSEGSADAARWDFVVPRRPWGGIRLPAVICALTKQFHEDPPGIVFSALPAANVATGVAALLAGMNTNVVITHHTPIHTHSRLLNFLDNFSGSLSPVKKVVSVSESVASTLVGKPAQYLRKRTTIHNALPPHLASMLNELGAQRDARPTGKREVIAIGRLSEQKNHSLLVHAAAYMPDVNVRIVGSGPLDRELKTLAQNLGVADRVNFTGHVSREQAFALLGAADVFSQVSLFEGHSLALLEAATIGMPIIVLNVPSQIEGIEARDGQYCGVVVEPGDAQGLARTITSLLNDREAYTRWSRLSKKLASEATFDTMVDAYENLVKAAGVTKSQNGGRKNLADAGSDQAKPWTIGEKRVGKSM
jgi:glycosyltransferase involved in cell wall biosynthesis